MPIEQKLLERSGNKCELCGSNSSLGVYDVPPVTDSSSDKSVLLCDTCKPQIEGTAELNINHWHCLNDSMWSQIPAVQVMAWRVLKRLSGETWAHDLLDIMYLEDDVRKWAEAMGDEEEAAVPTLDSNRARLHDGDNVTLVKDLAVKGAGFTAKRGTMVRGISLTNNPEHIEGKVNGVRVVLVAEYLKKA